VLTILNLVGRVWPEHRRRYSSGLYSSSITNMIYDDEIDLFPLPYGQAQPNMANFEPCGHFSQIVWKSTTSIGCSTVAQAVGLANTSPDIDPWFTVCNYSPAGNSQVEFGENIAKPSSLKEPEKTLRGKRAISVRAA
jgi:hypothetical protein